jgi:hypothetical protein
MPRNAVLTVAASASFGTDRTSRASARLMASAPGYDEQISFLKLRGLPVKFIFFPRICKVAHPPEGRAPVASDIYRAAATRIVHAPMRSHATVSSSNPGVLAHAASP